jgi:hypothetical protein
MACKECEVVHTSEKFIGLISARIARGQTNPTRPISPRSQNRPPLGVQVHIASFDIMIMPEAANVPPTPWRQTETWAPGIWAGTVPHIWRMLSYNAYMPKCMYESPPPLVLIGNLPRGAVLRSAMKPPVLPRGTKPRSSTPRSADARKRRRSSDGDVVVGDAGLGKILGAGDAEGARRGDDYLVAPAKAGSRANGLSPAALDARFRGNSG